jgi:outer membrane protein assembly factor BamB
MSFAIRFVVALAAVASLVSVSSGADWPEFRGPSGQGHAAASGLPTQWGPEKNVQWKTPIPGLGWSSPVVIGGRVYLTTAVAAKTFRDPEQSLRTLCLDAKTGEVLWDHEIFQQVSVDQATDRIHTKNSQASPTPVSDGKHLFVHFGTRGTACLTLDGDVVWKTTELKYAPVHGNGGSPILVDDMLVVSCDGGDQEFIVALNQSNGEIRWKTDRTATHLSKKFAFGTPLLIEVDGKRQIVSQGAGAVYGYRPEDGSMIWKVDYKDGYSVIPRPVFAHGLVYISSGYNKPILYAIDPSGEGDITATHVKWVLDREAPHTPSPLVVGDELYLVSDRGIATCLDARTGEVHWTERLEGKFSASPLFADDLIYYQAEEGETIIVRPGKEYQEVGRNQLEPRTFASFAVVDSSLLIRTEKQLYRIGYLSVTATDKSSRIK